MSEKFTKGIWEIEDRREESGSEYDYSIVAGDWYVANIVYNGMEEQEANAALIAAAPELYECLCDVMTDLEMSEGMRAHFEKVLKKARGEE